MTKKLIFFILLAVCLIPVVNAPLALILGFSMVFMQGNPYEKQSSVVVKWLLKSAIVGLGFGMNFYSALEAGKDGFLLTIVTIVLVLIMGWVIGNLLKIDKKISYLVSSGTAICGGSAIAAVSPIINAEPKQISVALGTIFILNAVALLIFPMIGSYFELTQHQFGLWSAIAIHDTSSVVGAASEYGDEALQTATTVKLGRALWIIPLSLATIFIFKTDKRQVNFPYFILFFIGAMLLSTLLPQLSSVYEIIVAIAKRALVVTMFLIGAGLSIAVIKATGMRTFAQGLLLWIIVSVTSLFAIVSWF